MEYSFGFKNSDTNEIITIPYTISNEIYRVCPDIDIPKGDITIDISDCEADINSILLNRINKDNLVIQTKSKYIMEGKSIITYDNTNYDRWVKGIKNDFHSLGKYEILRRSKSKRLNKKLNKKYGLKIKYTMITELNSYGGNLHELSVSIL